MKKGKMSRGDALAHARKMRVWAGHRPSGDRWKRIKVTESCPFDVPWVVYMAYADRTVGNKDGPWWQVKVIAAHPIRAKANYWLAFNGRRWARTKDYSDAKLHIPDVLEELDADIDELVEDWPCDSQPQDML